jgi:hypothetical protein
MKWRRGYASMFAWCRAWYFTWSILYVKAPWNWKLYNFAILGESDFPWFSVIFWFTCQTSKPVCRMLAGWLTIVRLCEVTVRRRPDLHVSVARYVTRYTRRGWTTYRVSQSWQCD